MDLKRYVLKPDSFLGQLVGWLCSFKFLLLPAILLLLFLILSQLFFTAIRYLFPQMRVVDWGTVEQGQWVQTLAIRDETILKAPFDGEIILLVDEGTRVPAGEPLAEMISSDFPRELKKDGVLVLRTIALRLYNIDQEITQLEKDIQYLQNQTREPEAIKGQLQKLTENKSQLISNYDNLIKTGDSYLPGWMENYQLVLSEKPGIFSMKIDGGEGLDILERDGIEDLFTRKYAANERFTTKVKQKKAWAKIISGHAQTLVCKLPEGLELEAPQEATLLVGGEKFPLLFLATDYTNNYWFFEENSLAPKLIDKRTFQAYLIYKRSTGVRIPRSALSYQEQTGWTVTSTIKGEKCRINVEVIDTNDQWAIIKGLPIGTAVFCR